MIDGISGVAVTYEKPYLAEREVSAIDHAEAVELRDKLQAQELILIAQIGSVGVHDGSRVLTVAGTLRNGNVVIPDGVDEVVVGPGTSGDGQTVVSQTIALYSQPRYGTA